MYQAAEYDLLKTIRPQKWYLTRAYKTIVAMAYVCHFTRTVPFPPLGLCSERCRVDRAIAPCGRLRCDQTSPLGGSR
jgi:hypothetical protein